MTITDRPRSVPLGRGVSGLISRTVVSSVSAILRRSGVSGLDASYGNDQARVAQRMALARRARASVSTASPAMLFSSPVR